MATLPDLTKIKGNNGVTKTRKTPARLSLSEKWAVAKYCIENRNVLRINGEFVARVAYTQTAREINRDTSLIPDKEVTAAIIQDCMQAYKTVCELTENMPFQTPLETVEADQLKIKLAQMEGVIGGLTDQAVQREETITKLKETLGKISRLIPDNCIIR